MIYGKYNENKVKFTPYVKYNGSSVIPISGWSKKDGVKVKIWEYQEVINKGYVIDQRFCIGCMICINECPTGAIYVNSDGKCSISPKMCTECGTCMDVCPSEAIYWPR